MDEASHPVCEVCWAIVPTALMPFHRGWHRQPQPGANRFYESAKAEVHELLQLVAALQAIPPSSIRPEFVAGLRDALMAEAFSSAIDDEGQPGSASRTEHL